MILRELVLKKRIYTDDEWVALMNTLAKAKQNRPEILYKLHRANFGKHLRPFVDVWNEAMQQAYREDEQRRAADRVLRVRGGD